MLVAGNVIIGRREEKDPNEDAETGTAPTGGEEEGEDLLVEEVELEDGVDAAGKDRERVGERVVREEDEDILDLGEDRKYEDREGRL